MYARVQTRESSVLSFFLEIPLVDFLEEDGVFFLHLVLKALSLLKLFFHGKDP